MDIETYKKYIHQMVDEITCSLYLKQIFTIVHRLFINDGTKKSN